MDYDVIIIGSGPAGASTAMHLAEMAPRIAARTLVLERDTHPRHKLCGGGCVIDVETCLQNLGLDLSQVPQADAKWIHLNYHNAGFKMRMGERAFRVVRRNEFDAWLAANMVHRGIELREQTTVTDLQVESDGVVVRTNQGDFRAKIVVGADGAKGMVRKYVGPDAPTQVARVVEMYTPMESSIGLGQAEANEAVMDFDCVAQGIQGYSWCFPMKLNGRPMRNFGAYDSGINPQGKSSGSLRSVMKEYLERYGHRMEDYELQGHPIRMFLSQGVFSSPRLMLVGDAAGVDAAFGEGISPALGYGPIAAEMIRDAFESGDFSLAEYKNRVLRSSLGKSLARRTWIAKQIYRLQTPWMQSMIWRHCGAAVRWVIRNFVFNWAKPIPAPALQPASVLPEISLSTASAERSTAEQRPNTVVHPEQPVPKPHLPPVTSQTEVSQVDRLSETR
ncbi:MAG: hypothetical protein DWH81_04210 [Planctomycetota bacterium]|nr:MAG: hypothetical protein DWH81_04210 [Planctomycetota bacterium]